MVLAVPAFKTAILHDVHQPRWQRHSFTNTVRNARNRGKWIRCWLERFGHDNLIIQFVCRSYCTFNTSGSKKQLVPCAWSVQSKLTQFAGASLSAGTFDIHDGWRAGHQWRHKLLHDFHVSPRYHPHPLRKTRRTRHPTPKQRRSSPAWRHTSDRPAVVVKKRVMKLRSVYPAGGLLWNNRVQDLRTVYTDCGVQSWLRLRRQDSTGRQDHFRARRPR